MFFVAEIATRHFNAIFTLNPFLAEFNLTLRCLWGAPALIFEARDLERHVASEAHIVRKG